MFTVFLFTIGVGFICLRNVLSAAYPRWMGYTPRAITLTGCGLIIAALLNAIFDVK